MEPKTRDDDTAPSTGDDGARGERSSRDGVGSPETLSGDAFDGVEELVRVVPLALSQLLSFDHLR